MLSLLASSGLLVLEAITLVIKADWSLSHSLMQDTDSIPYSDFINQNVRNFTQFISQAVNDSILKSSPTSHKRPVSWWNPELKRTIKQRKP